MSDETDYGCTSCDSCQSCDSGCQAICNSCEGTCNRCQAFCETGGQIVPRFSFGQCVASGQSFLSKSNWNNFINHINNARHRGSKKSATSWTIVDNNTIMTAEKFNEVSRAVNSGQIAPSGTANPYVNVGDIIYGSYFQTLENYTNGNYRYMSDQCDDCNINCDVSCDGCQGCDSGCQYCVDCNGCNSEPVGSHCCGCDNCDTCQSCDTCEGCDTDTPTDDDAS